VLGTLRLTHRDLYENVGTWIVGSGRHFCLGASLTRLEARVCLEELVGHVREGYDIAEEHAERVHSVNVRGSNAFRPRSSLGDGRFFTTTPGGFDDSAVLRI
jgi:hypothetical protein